MSKLDSANRNIFLNGGMSVFQRSLLANLPPSMSYVTADRWRLAYTGTVTGTPTCGQSSDVPSNGKSMNSLFLTAQRNSSGLSLMIAQRIESSSAVECSSEIVSIGCQYKSPVANQMVLTLRVPNTADNYSTSNIIYTQTINIVTGSTWNKAVFEGISLPSLLTGLEAEIKFVLPSGTDASPVTHLITQIKMNVGRNALGFSRAGFDINDELNKCFRYYELTPITMVISGASRGLYVPAYYKVYKRTIPTLTLYSGGLNSGTIAGLPSDSKAGFRQNTFSTADIDALIAADAEI